MAVIKVEEDDKVTMHDVGEMQKDYDDCCPVETESTTKMKKHYPTVYLYEIPDALFNQMEAGADITIQLKGKVKEVTERITDRADEGKKTRRTVDLEIHEVSNPL